MLFAQTVWCRSPTKTGTAQAAHVAHSNKILAAYNKTAGALTLYIKALR
jgi:hypothetical protein